MRTERRRTPLALMALSLLALPASAAAQTPATALGLGLPVPAVDARAAALGGTGVGLLGGSLSHRNPAEIGFLTYRVLGITYAPAGVSVKGADGSADGGRSRLGVLRGAVPFDDWAIGLSFASELDQDWQIAFDDTLVTDGASYPFTEQRTQDGGISSVNLAVARRFGRFALGAEYGVLIGSMQQRFLRRFQADTINGTGQPGGSSGLARWQYRGSRLKLGAAGDVTDGIRVAADFSLQGDLTAERDSILGIGLTRTYDMPAAFEAGVSARVSERLLLTGAGGWTGWAGAEGGSTTHVAADVVWFGVGAEFTGTSLLGAEMPLRLGLRRTGLPFHPPGADQLSETALTLGFGLRVADEQAGLDVALEIGSRGDLGASGVEESFQRLSLTLALFQD